MANITSIKVRKTDTVYGIQDAAASLAIEQMKNGTDIDSFGDVETALADKADASDLNAILDGTDIDSFGDVETALAGKMQNYYLEENINAVLDMETGHTNLVTKTTDTISSGITTIPTSRGVDGAFTQIIVSEFTVLDNYAVGDYVKYEGKVYKCTTAHSAGAWVAGDFTQVKVLDEVKNLNTNAFPRDEQRVLGAKNLYEPVIKANGSNNGVTAQFLEDGVHLSGTATGGSSTMAISGRYNTSTTPFRFFKNGNYIVSGGIENKTYLRCGVTKNNAYYELGSGYGDIPITIDGDDGHTDGAYLLISIVTPLGNNVDNVIIRPMVRLGSDNDSRFVPYAMTNKELTEKVQGIINAATNAADFAAFKTAIGNL